MSTQTKVCDCCTKTTPSSRMHLSFEIDAGWVCGDCRDYYSEHGELPKGEQKGVTDFAPKADGDSR